MYDPESVIQRRVDSSAKYLNDKINPAVRRQHVIEIKTLSTVALATARFERTKFAKQTAPRTVNEIERLLAKRLRVKNTTNVLEAHPIYDEIAVLEWLLNVVKLKDTDHSQDDIL